MTPISTLDRVLITPPVPLTRLGAGDAVEEGEDCRRRALASTTDWPVADLWPLFEAALEAIG